MKVLFLTQYYPPESGAPQARISEMAQRLRARGVDVQVLTALPSYPKGRVFDDYRRRPWVRERREGIRVVRTPIYPTKSAGLARRLSNYFSFVASSAALAPLLVERPDVVVTESPPLFLGLTGLYLKTLFRCRHVLNVSDLWPESAVRMGMNLPGWGIRAAEALERLLYQQSDAKTGQSAGIVRGILAKDPGGDVTLIPNGCDCERFQPARRDLEFLARHGLSGKTVVGYAGLMGLAQGMRLMLEVADARRDRDDLRFVLAGDGPEREALEAEAQARGLANLVFTGLLPRDAMPGVVASFDVALIPLRYSIPGALPSKIYEAMASRVPIVLPATGDPAELLERAGAGPVVDYDDPAQVTEAVRRLADDPAERERLGQRGREFAERHHDREGIADRFLEVLERTVGGAGSPTSADQPTARLARGKRALDVALSGAALLGLSPALVGLGAAVRLTSPGPALFRQRRVGLGGRDFTIYKFRTMTAAPRAEEGSFDAGDTSRVTRLGRWLRATKLDELPQLVNVLRGDMSLVGPRPEVRPWVEAYPERWARVHTVRPGITDPASLEFRSEEQLLAAAPDPEACYREEVLPRKLDLYERYVASASTLSDLAIVARTLALVTRTALRP